ncbi:MAG: methyl-accepting chemotaxis protein [Mariprofundales bacterium]
MAQVKTKAQQGTSWLSSIGNLNVKQKILLSGLALAVLPVLASNFILGQRAVEDGSLMATTQVNVLLSSVRDTKKTQIENFYNGLESHLSSLARSTTVIEGSREFTDAIVDYGFEPMLADELAIKRELLRKYYTDEFAVEYLKHNTSATIDASTYVDKIDSTTVWLQYNYISANPHPLGEKNKLHRLRTDNAFYHDVHAKYHDDFNVLIEKFGYYDVFLIDTASDRIVYSVFKEADFGTNMTSGRLVDSGIAKLYAKIKQAGKEASFTAQAFAEYNPSYDALAGFVGAPVFDQKGNMISVIIVQVSDNSITDLLTNKKDWLDIGLGETGEVYLVAKDGKVQSNTRPMLENSTLFLSQMQQLGIPPASLAKMTASHNTFGNLAIKSPSVTQAFTGNVGIHTEKNYLQQSVLTAYGIVSVHGLEWAILAQMGEEEAIAPVAILQNSLQKVSWMVAIIVVIGAVLLALIFARVLTTPLSSIEGTVRRLTAGDFEARCRMDTGDEFQALGDAIDALVEERAEFLDSEEASNLLNDNIIKVLDAVAELSQRNLTINVPVTEDIIGPVADSLNLMTEEISDTMNSVNSISNNVEGSTLSLEKLAADVNALAESENTSVQNMTTKLAQASKSLIAIAEIAEKSNATAQLASERVQAARATVGKTASGMHDIREIIHETEKRIKRLGERSQEISSITDIINTIAERTHVLSINASMQAAAAGEAGRGFSVVAEEVQRLAESSRSATAQIATLVKNIQIETVDASETMARTIEQVVAGSELADSAGRIMQESGEITAKLADTVNQIALMSEEQANIGQSLRQDADVLRVTTEETSVKIAEQNVETEKLTGYSNQLRETVGTFKLS